MGFFDSVIDFFTSIWTFITNFVQSLITAILLLSQSISLTTYLTAYVFPLLGSCIIAVAAVAAIKLIVGWGNQ